MTITTRQMKKIIKKALEAHNKKMTTMEAAKFAGVSQGTLMKCWKKEKLRPHYRGSPPISNSKIDKIYEGYGRKMTTKEITEYAGVSKATVLNYLKLRELKSNKKKTIFSKILEAYKKEMTTKEITEYAGVSRARTITYLKKKGLNPYKYEKKENSARIQIRSAMLTTVLLDNVFNTANQVLSFKDIKNRIDLKLGRGVRKKTLEKEMTRMIELGYYKKINTENGIMYKAGMPKAMGLA